MEEKVYSERFGSDRLKRMEGKGTSHLHNSASALRFVCVWVWGKWGQILDTSNVRVCVLVHVL